MTNLTLGYDLFSLKTYKNFQAYNDLEGLMSTHSEHLVFIKQLSAFVTLTDIRIF